MTWSVSYDDIINNIAHSGSTQLIVKLFGGQVYKIFHISANYSGPDQTLLSIFGSLMFGIVLWGFVCVALYFIFTGLINQSQSGEFMHKNWNGFWPILRLGFGVSSVIPFPGTNFLLIQAFVIAISMMSSSVADLTWTELLKEAGSAGISDQKNLTPTIDAAKTMSFVNDAYHYSICLANGIMYESPDAKLNLNSVDPLNPFSNPEVGQIALSCSSDRFQLFLGTQPSQPSPPDLTPAPNSDLISNDSQAKFNNYQNQQYRYWTETVMRSYITKIWGLVQSNITQINSGDTGEQQAVSQALGADAKQFQADLSHDIQSAVSNDQNMKDNFFANQVGLYGWISAGNYYRQLAQQQQIVSNAISSALQHTSGYVALSRQSDLTAASNITAFGNQNGKAVSAHWMNVAANNIGDPLGFGLLKYDETTDPILAMTSFGQKLEGAAEVLFGAKIAGGILGFIPGVSSIIGGILNNAFLNFVMGITAIAGIVLGTVLPCMPWIIFLFAVIGWLIHVAEMFVASPFWIVANAMPDGNTMISDVARKGANNILFIILFPTLALGGLVASLSISWIGMGLVNQFTYSGFQAIVGYGTFPLAFIGILLIYVVLAWTVLLSSLNLIQEFPRTILNWISLSAPGASPFKDKHEGLYAGLMAGPIAGSLSTKALDSGKKSLGESTARIASAVRKLKKK